jgi:hypothetical protein
MSAAEIIGDGSVIKAMVSDQDPDAEILFAIAILTGNIDQEGQGDDTSAIINMVKEGGIPGVTPEDVRRLLKSQHEYE